MNNIHRILFLKFPSTVQKAYPYLAVIIFLCIIITRQLTSFTTPQLYAEDSLRLQTAYQVGPVRSLFLPQFGYLEAFNLLLASVASLFPLQFSPVIYITFSLFVRIYLLIILISKRNTMFQYTYQKFLCALFVVLLPNTSEIHINANYSYWYLVLSACIILFFTHPSDTKWGMHDICIVTLSSLSGLFAPFLFLLVGIRYALYKTKRLFIFTLLTFLGTCIQAFYFTSFYSYPFFTFHMFQPDGGIQIFENQIIWGTLIGPQGFFYLQQYLSTNVFAFISHALSIMGICCILYVSIRARIEWKIFILFGGLMFYVSSFRATGGYLDPSVWHTVALLFGTRFWLIPSFVFLLCILFILWEKKSPIVIKVISYLFILIMFIFLMLGQRSYFYESLENLHWNEYMDVYRQASIGTMIHIPINPPGWSLDVIKK